MSFDSLWFLVKSALNNLYRNFLLTVASVTVLSICLTLLGCTTLVIQNVNEFVEEIGESRIAVFLEEDMDELDIAQFQEELRDIGNIGEISYETKEQALANYLEGIGEGTGMEDALDACVDSLIRQIRKNKTRLDKKLHSAVLDDFIDTVEEETEFDIIREKTVALKPQSVEEAILQMNLLGHQFYMFLNADTDEINVVYKRNATGYGLIAPDTDK